MNLEQSSCFSLLTSGILDLPHPALLRDATYSGSSESAVGERDQKGMSEASLWQLSGEAQADKLALIKS